MLAKLCPPVKIETGALFLFSFLKKVSVREKHEPQRRAQILPDELLIALLANDRAYEQEAHLAGDRAGSTSNRWSSRKRGAENLLKVPGPRNAHSTGIPESHWRSILVQVHTSDEFNVRSLVRAAWRKRDPYHITPVIAVALFLLRLCLVKSNRTLDSYS
jgi:hypothetical protein